MGDDDDLSISGIHVGMAWIAGQILTRWNDNKRPLVVLMDGQKSLWDTFAIHFDFGPKVVPILDILHVLMYIWEASSLFETDDQRRRDFTRKRLLMILNGNVKSVIRGLRRMGTSVALHDKPAKALTRICNYLSNNAERMRYNEYLKQGYPIASGVIEGACRHLVKDRMERSGMRWTL